ncbi:MAG: crotonase/enoyl-CoA hydratase family protein [Microthrixaceae bacterium]
MNKPDTTADEVLTERRGRVMLITLNRPDALNAINQAVATGVVEAIEELDSDPGLTAAVLTGAGRGFCSGMDLKEFAKTGTPDGFERFLESGSTKPLIAAVEGFALAGGFEIVLTCDLVVAAQGAKFGVPEARVGLFAAGGALFRLPTRVGFGKAMEMALTADPITAEDAQGYGLVAEVTTAGGAVEAALALAERIARNAPLAVAASKDIVREAQGRTEAECWEYQKQHARVVFRSEDSREGPRAFAEKRAPNWTGT